MLMSKTLSGLLSFHCLTLFLPLLLSHPFLSSYPADSVPPPWCWGESELHVFLPFFLPQQSDPSERSRAVASHGVRSRPYWIRMGTAVLVYAPSFNSTGTMGAGQARGPVRPGYTEARQTQHWRGWGSIRNQRRLMWKSQVQCLEKRLLVGNSRQEALWYLQRLYAAEQTVAVWSSTHITAD